MVFCFSLLFCFLLMLEVTQCLAEGLHIWWGRKELLSEKGEGRRETFSVTPFFVSFTFSTMSMYYLLLMTFIKKLNIF